MNDKDIEAIANSDIVRCPYKDCNTYGSYHQCYNHSYCVCLDFSSWYDLQDSEDIQDIYNKE